MPGLITTYGRAISLHVFITIVSALSLDIEYGLLNGFFGASSLRLVYPSKPYTATELKYRNDFAPTFIAYSITLFVPSTLILSKSLMSPQGETFPAI